ncbi:MAG: hypothetical protein ABI432_13085 [Flavobacteriales bacterium]
MSPRSSFGIGLASTKGMGACAFLFFLFFAWSSIGFNGKVPLDDWKTDLKADAAGYYIYLPGLFHHGMHAATVSDSLVALGGYGFEVDRERDRIVTKYTYGTALLELPFFLVAEAIEGFGATDGWTRTHHQAIEVSGIFYWTAGLLLIALALRRWWPSTIGIALLVLVGIAFGTNTFYYAFRSAGYSHIYSFFLVAVGLYAIYADRGGPMRRWLRWVFVIANALIVLIRPIDAMAVLALMLLLLIERPALFRSLRLYAEQFVAAALVVLPQLFYWKFVHGSWVVYSYGDEGFSAWASPHWKEVLLAPMNGLNPHAPLFALLVPGLVVMARHDKRTTWVVGGVVLVALYSIASWWQWYFGCSYGMRPMVQYTPFLAMGLWALFSWARARVPMWLHGAVPLLVLLCFVNYRAMLQYGCCYDGEAWDWIPYGRNILEAFFGKVAF